MLSSSTPIKLKREICKCEDVCPCKKIHGDDGMCQCKRNNHELQEYWKSNSTTKKTEMYTLLESRSNSLILAWKDTLENRLLNTTDPNVMYDMWYSNMARRGLAKLYACIEIFEESKEYAIDNSLTVDIASNILEPYIDKEFVKCKPNPVNNICMN